MINEEKGEAPASPQAASEPPEFSVEGSNEKHLKDKLVADQNSSRRHVHAAMEEALNRYGQKLQAIEDEKKMQEQDL